MYYINNIDNNENGYKAIILLMIELVIFIFNHNSCRYVVNQNK